MGNREIAWAASVWLESKHNHTFFVMYGSQELVNISHDVDATVTNPPFNFCNSTIRNTKVQIISSRALEIAECKAEVALRYWLVMPSSTFVLFEDMDRMPKRERKVSVDQPVLSRNVISILIFF